MSTPTPSRYEVFCDSAYYNMWAVRVNGEKRWGHCYHLPSKEEAEGLAQELQGHADWNDANVDTALALKADQLERDLAAARAEVEKLRGALALGQENCDAEFDRLREERDEARAEVERLRDDKARLDWLAKGDTYGKLSSVRLSLPTAFYPTPIAHDCIRAAIDSARKEQP
jgi:hypothetical protein